MNTVQQAFQLAAVGKPNYRAHAEAIRYNYSKLESLLYLYGATVFLNHGLPKLVYGPSSTEICTCKR